MAFKQVIKHDIITLNKHVHYFTQPTHNYVKQLNQIHVHVIMHELLFLPYIIAPMHQYMFMVFIQT